MKLSKLVFAGFFVLAGVSAASAQVAQPGTIPPYGPPPPDYPVTIKYQDVAMAQSSLDIMNKILCAVAPNNCTANNVQIGSVQLDMEQAVGKASQQFQADAAKARADSAAKAASDAKAAADAHAPTAPEPATNPPATDPAK